MITVVKPLETRAYPLYSEMTEPQLIEKRNILMDELEGMLNKAKLERRSLNGAETNQFNDLKNQVQEVDKALQALKLSIDDLSGGGSSDASTNANGGQRAYT